ncbi:DUF3617 family protein [Phenylobacterium sp.]|uniref:DUF3617 domain-containing protein n=1 Tax=Phenylobacterium sp. TaxID=1871053 RepID=UPI0025D07ABF|nr:DUF3617 family protein [Phenylobacterium sp.]
MKRVHLTIAAVLIVAAGTASAQTVRRAGEWQVTVTPSSGRPNPPKNFCYPEGSAADFTKRMGNCAKHDIHTVGNQHTVDAECSVGTRQSKVHMVITSHGSNAYHAEMEMSVSPPMPGLSSTRMSEDARWLGPCTPGEKPAP